jgi:hypothetical protein
MDFGVGLRLSDFPRSTRRELASFGHHLACLRTVLGALRSQHAKGRLPAAMMKHAGLCLEWLPSQTGTASVIETELVIPDTAPAHWAVLFETHWLRPSWLSPGARALLHAPGLGGYWQARLRRGILQNLRRRIAPAWVVDGTPLPPGAGISGLGIHDWRDLHRLRNEGLSFTIVFKDDPGNAATLSPQRPASDWMGVGEQLGAAVPGTAVVMPAGGKSGAQIRLRHIQQQGRWELADPTPR